MDPVRLQLNGESFEVTDVSPTTTLLEYLRGSLGWSGTKEGCAEGDCGACTVVVIDPHAPGGPRFRGVNSCILPLTLLHGQSVFTVEALRGGPSHYHPVQEALVQALGSQCGYCTPGVIMSMFEACYRLDLDAPWKLDDQMCGNLCRCTGYRPIRDATQAIAGLCPSDRFSAALSATDPDQPPVTGHYAAGSRHVWIPGSLDELWELLESHPTARLVAGATDLGLDITKRRASFDALISLQSIGSLRQLHHRDHRWSIGATVRLADLEDATGEPLPALAKMLRFFGSRQIKNRATVGGNLCNASPIGDLAPVLLSLDAQCVVQSRVGVRRIPIDEFFVDYRQTALQVGEVLVRVEVPDPQPQTRIVSYKVSKRREMDISCVAAGLRVDVTDGIVHAARFGFGGVAATPIRARRAEAAIVGQPWTEAACERAATELVHDVRPRSDHRGSAWYRATVAANLLRAMFAETVDDPHPRVLDRPSATIRSHG